MGVNPEYQPNPRGEMNDEYRDVIKIYGEKLGELDDLIFKNSNKGDPNQISDSLNALKERFNWLHTLRTLNTDRLTYNGHPKYKGGIDNERDRLESLIGILELFKDGKTSEAQQMLGEYSRNLRKVAEEKNRKANEDEITNNEELIKKYEAEIARLKANGENL